MSGFPDIAIQTYCQGDNHVVFIHGYGETSFIWDETVTHLCENLEGVSVHTLNLPGFEDSVLTDNLTSLKDIADSIKDNLKKRNINNATFIGHSLGGYVLMHLIAYHSALVNKACFVNSSIFSDTKSKKEQRNKVIEFLKKNGTEAFITNFIPDLYFESNRDRNKPSIQIAIEKGNGISQNTMVRYMEMMRDREDLSNSLITFSKPVHFIIGKNDQSVPFSISAPQISIPQNSTALILEDCGHMAMYEKWESYISSLMTFISI